MLSFVETLNYISAHIIQLRNMSLNKIGNTMNKIKET